MRSNEEFKQFFETILNAKKEQPVSKPLLVGAAFGGGMSGNGGFGGALFGAPPPPPTSMVGASFAMQSFQPQMECYDECAMQN
jgi:hypothetical protein